jgi:hypothetical protein
MLLSLRQEPNEAESVDVEALSRMLTQIYQLGAQP